MEKIHPKNIIRNTTLAGALLISGGTVAACNSNSDNNINLQPSIESLTPNPALLESPELNNFKLIILNEVKKRDLKISSYEQNLWQESEGLYEYNPETSKNLTRDQKDNLTFERFTNTVRISSLSNNEKIKNNANDIINMVGQGFVSVAPFTSDTPGAPLRFIAGFNNDGSMYASLAVDIDFTLDESDSRIMGISLVQGSTAMMNALEYAISLPDNLSPEEKNNILAQFDNKQERAKTFAEEAEAYIQEVGLLGETFTLPNSEIQKRAARYIELGMDSSSPEWIDFIENDEIDTTLIS